MAVVGACPMCFDSILPDEVGVTDPCGHVFHQSCWNTWEQSSSKINLTTCPICQKRVTKIIKVFGLDSSSNASQQEEEISRLEEENAKLKKWMSHKEEAEKRDKRMARALQNLA
jgi:hypothetical protein